MEEDDISLGIEFEGFDEGLKELREMAQEFRQMQKLIDGITTRAQGFAKSLRDGSAQTGQLRTLKMQMPSSPVPAGTPSGAASGVGIVGKIIGGASELGAVLGTVAEAVSADLLGPVVAVGLALKALTEAAASAANDFRNTQITSGGTVRETGILRGLGYATDTDAGALSRQLADRLSHDSAAAGFGHMAGIHDSGGAYSDLDKAKNLIRAMDFIHYTKDDATAKRFARVEGLEPLLKLRGVDDKKFEEFKKSSGALGDSFDPKTIGNYNLEMAKFNLELDHLKLSLGEYLLPLATEFIGNVAKAVDAINTGIDRFEKWYRRITGQPEDTRQDQRKRTEEDHASAMREHSAALRNGVYGGGQRARNAIPEGWGGANVKDWAPQARALGAFG